MSSVRPPLRDVALVFGGGAVGAVARVAFATWFPTEAGTYPWTTFLENVLGAFLLALVLTALAARTRAAPRAQLLLGTGVLGAFTTYSTLAVELERLVDGGAVTIAVGYALGSLVAGIVAATAGIVVGRIIGRAASGRPAGGPA